MKGQVLITSTGGGLTGKPRPAVIVQDDGFDFADTVIIVPLTTENSIDHSVRPLISPDAKNGLKQLSCAMVNRMAAIRKADINAIVGRLSDDDMTKIDAAMSAILGLGSV